MEFTINGNTYELITLSLAGSHLYGNSRPESDWDYRGVFIAKNETFLGLLGTVEQVEGVQVYEALTKSGLKLEETDDIVLWELNRFCKLALDNNPNIIDILCHDYTNPKFSIYCNDKGKELLSNKYLFMSTKLKHTFSGYAISQLKRIKGHNKWLNEFPNTGELLDYIKSKYGTNIDWDWVCDNFGGNVAEYVSNETAQEHTTLPKQELFSWTDFNVLFNETRIDFDKYRLPQLIDYCFPKKLQGERLSLEDIVDDITTTPNMPNCSLRTLLEDRASFRTMSPSMLVIYTEGKGIFSKEGNLKVNDPETIGEFVCLLSIDQMKYKSDKDHINKMWQWKCNRNEKRGKLEEEFGIDTKHASHLVRLMEGCKDILTTGVYKPTLSGDRLQFVNDVRNGKYKYEWLIEYSERLDEELTELSKTSILPKKPNVKEVNKLVLKLRNY